jgi:ABC-type glycerol-3-phosphate transport system substrate-binding protein
MKRKVYHKGTIAVLSLVVVLSVSCIGWTAKKPYAGVTLHTLLEELIDTTVVRDLLPEFERETGIKVDIEAVQYMTMHEKLLPNLIAPEGSGSYDFLQVDSYWVGEFVSAGWLLSLEELVKNEPTISGGKYIPSLMEMTGELKGLVYMLPQWTYPFGLVYRKDIVDSPKFQKAYKEKFGREWRIPQSIPEYAEVAKLAAKIAPAGVAGCAMQAARIDPIVMEWTNYLYSMGGDIYDRRTWKSTINSPVAIEAARIYKDLVDNAAQPGATGANFDDMFNTFAQGKAVFAISHNFLMPELEDPRKSRVAGKIELVPVPGKGGQLGGWGWAIPKSSPNPEAAWEFLKWVESEKIAYQRAMGGGMPCQEWIYRDKYFIEKYPFQAMCRQIIAMGTPQPIISQSTEMIEIVGENLSAMVIGDLSVVEAMNKAAKELDKLASKDPMVKEMLGLK